MNKVVILGAGGSAGVPTAVNSWGKCDPENPKNRRTRPSVFFDVSGIKILIDTSPDLRQQMLANGIEDLDAVLFTHDHADHTHGIDELKTAYFQRDKRKIPIYGSESTIKSIKKRFDYLFQEREKSIYLSILEPHVIEDKFKVQGVEITAFPQVHGLHVISTGFRIGDIAYSTDFSDLYQASLDKLRGLETWIVDCAGVNPRPGPYQTHLYLEKSLEWISLVKPKRAILIHLGVTLDYETVRNSVPQGVEPGYDGLTIYF